MDAYLGGGSTCLGADPPVEACRSRRFAPSVWRHFSQIQAAQFRSAAFASQNHCLFRMSRMPFKGSKLRGPGPLFPDSVSVAEIPGWAGYGWVNSKPLEASAPCNLEPRAFMAPGRAIPSGPKMNSIIIIIIIIIIVIIIITSPGQTEKNRVSVAEPWGTPRARARAWAA